ncbi:MAG: hypothetical protein HC897_01405 [Thermoanaerobaculia bacterium]|nr:hypothetical protein [Thermoanaerobaculia bacterium]
MPSIAIVDKLGKLILAQLLVLAQDADRFSDRDADAFCSGAGAFYSMPPMGSADRA